MKLGPAFCLSRPPEQAPVCLFSRMNPLRAYPPKGLPCCGGKWRLLCLLWHHPPWAFPLSVLLNKHTPVLLCFLGNTYKEAEVYEMKWHHPKKACEKQPWWEDCPRIFFGFFSSFFSKIVKTNATHTCKRIKKGEKIAAGSCFPHCYLVAP